MCLYFLAIFLPPLAVFFKTGCDSNFIINILLSILGWLPGVIRKLAPPCWFCFANLHTCVPPVEVSPVTVDRALWNRFD